MTRHLTSFELERYIAGALTPAASADLEQHVASCLSCRTLVDDRAVRLVRVLRPVLEEADDDHVGDEEMAAYVDGALDVEQRTTISAHLELCARCDLDRQALERERDHIASQPGTPAARRWPTLMAMAATLLAAASLGVWWMSRPHESGAPRTAQVATPVAAPAAPQPRLALVDGARRIEVDTDGRVTGLPALPAEQSAALVATLTSGALEVASAAELTGRADLLMGGASTAPAASLSPAGEVVESDRPEFTWSAVPGATSYVVTVLDGTLRPVASSRSLETRRWIPDAPLPRGAAYVWQVSASTPSGSVVLPAPPAPEARVRVVDAGTSTALMAARASGSPLSVGVLSAKAGLLADAERALLEVVSANPDSKLAAELLAQLRSARQ